MIKPKATEQRNPRTRGIDAKSTLEILRAIHREDASVAKAVSGALPAIARAVDAIAGAMRAGRTSFLRWRRNERTPRGARRGGTSADVWHAAAHGPGRDRRRPPRTDARRGRRGRQSHARGQGSGGARAHREGRGRRNRRQRCDTLRSRARWNSQKERARSTIGLTSNPRTPITQMAQISIVTPTGPEVITGSTRMKAGTAQKLVLNMLSTSGDDSPRPRVRQLDDRRGPDEQQVAGSEGCGS